MATTASEQTGRPAVEASLRWGSWLMGAAAVGFIGYAVIFVIGALVALRGIIAQSRG